MIYEAPTSQQLLQILDTMHIWQVTDSKAAATATTKTAAEKRNNATAMLLWMSAHICHFPSPPHDGQANASF